MKIYCPNPRCQHLCPEYANNCPYCGTLIRGTYPPPPETELKKCRRCHGTGFSDYPVSLEPCTNPQCNGGYIRV